MQERNQDVRRGTIGGRARVVGGRSAVAGRATVGRRSHTRVVGRRSTIGRRRVAVTCVNTAHEPTSELSNTTPATRLRALSTESNPTNTSAN